MALKFRFTKRGNVLSVDTCTIPEEKSVSIPSGETLTVAMGEALVNNGAINTEDLTDNQRFRAEMCNSD